MGGGEGEGEGEGSGEERKKERTEGFKVRFLIHTFISLVIQQIFSRHLLLARHHARHWGYNRERDGNDAFLQETSRLMGQEAYKLLYTHHTGRCANRGNVVGPAQRVY